MSEIKVNKISPTSGGGTVTLATSGDTIQVPSGVTIANSGTATGFGGKTVQMQFTRHTGNVSWTHGSAGTATELTTGNRVTITPTSTSNYLILEAFVPLSGGGTTSIYNFMFYDVTGSAVFNPSAETIGSRGATWGRGLLGHRGSHADANDQNELYMRQIGLAPRTSETVFAIYGRGQSGSAFYINYDSGGDATWGFSGQTLFTVTEMDLS